MKTRSFIITCATLISAIGIWASNEWLNIYHHHEGQVKVSANALTDIDSLYYTACDSMHPEAFTHINIQSGLNGHQSVALSDCDSIIFGTNVPTLYIDTDPYVEEITSKTNYLRANLRYIPYGDGTDTLTGEVGIRGRGNVTWILPKKPYRLKFDKKQSLGGLKKAKSYVLLANYLDATLTKNAAAFKLAEMLGMPFHNHSVPVNLVFNGKNHASYQLTEKIGINAGSVDIDEATGILWELDTYFDEKYRFNPSAYPIPAMAKDPDFLEIADGDAEKENELWEYWKADLETALDTVKYGDWKSAFDIDQAVDFILINHVFGNHEISYPKSVYLYKENPDGKYKFGPIWDLDWTVGYEHDITTPLINRQLAMYDMYVKILMSDDFLEAFAARFGEFEEIYLPRLMDYIDEYAARIRVSAYQDSEIWTDETILNEPDNPPIRKTRFDESVKELKDWIKDRVALIRTSDNFLLIGNE